MTSHISSLYERLDRIRDLFAAENAADAEREAKQQQWEARRQQQEAAAWHTPRTLARFLTLAGQSLGREDLTVTITETGPRDTDRTFATNAVCGGCGETSDTHWDTYPWRSLSDVHEEITVREAAEEAETQARHWARTHSEQCRELPVEG